MEEKDQATRFANQGGIANSDPSPLARRMTSHAMRYLMASKREKRKWAGLERKRKSQGQPHIVEYFHQVDDAYSYLAAQVLQRLQEKYEIQLVCHLVRGPEGRNAPEPEMLAALSGRDAAQIAATLNLDFPREPAKLEPHLLKTSQAIMAAVDEQLFIELAPRVSSALWAGDGAALTVLAAKYGRCSEADTATRLETGTARRKVLGHYSGAMFYYQQDWYWGVDRLNHLESRLASLQALRSGQEALPHLVERPDIASGPWRDNGSLTLEFYASLRSPYTAISYDRTLELAATTGVNLKLRPVLPMVMRGVSATRQKGFYIFSDASREAGEIGYEDWGSGFYDPIGEPARRCYSMYPWARSQGKGKDLIGAFLKAAFFAGVNTNNDKGLRQVVENAGLNWAEAKQHLGSSGWEQELEENRLAMYGFGSWGVPCYRLLNENGAEVLGAWGQDRLWLVAQKIQSLLAERQVASP